MSIAVAIFAKIELIGTEALVADVDLQSARLVLKHCQCCTPVARLQPQEQCPRILDVALATACSRSLERDCRGMIGAANKRQRFCKSAHRFAVYRCFVQLHIP